MDRLTATPIPGTAGATKPFFSPDGQWVGFSVDGAIKKIAIRGGAAQVICDTQAYNSVTWSDDGTIFFTTTSGGGLSRVSANGGTPQVLTTPNRDQRERTHRGPEALPGGQALIMTVGTADITSYDEARIEVLTLATGQRRVLIQGGMNARYVSTGHLIYARAGSLLAVPFDLKRLEVTGPPITVVEDVFTDPIMGLANFAISRDGSLLYAPGGARTHLKPLVWVDRQGRSQPVNGIRRSIAAVRLSPDGQRIALGLNGATSEVWLHDLARTTSTRLVYGWDNSIPVWTPDGTRVAFISNRATAGVDNLFWQAADGTGVAERLTTNASLNQSPESWSPDGRFLVFRQWEAATSSDLWVFSIDERKARPLIQTRASESGARVSPDGRWIAYESDQSGQFEVYVRAFPGPSRDRQISIDGGSAPRWAPNGRELFYRKDNKMMAVEVSTKGEFVPGTPKQLFEGPFVLWPDTYDVARDGRFLMLKNEPQPVSQLILVQNWFEELKAKTGSREP
jgi:Tol biopolymer transport system component